MKKTILILTLIFSAISFSNTIKKTATTKSKQKITKQIAESPVKKSAMEKEFEKQYKNIRMDMFNKLTGKKMQVALKFDEMFMKFFNSKTNAEQAFYSSLLIELHKEHKNYFGNKQIPNEYALLNEFVRNFYKK